jgi:hypothetical protein
MSVVAQKRGARGLSCDRLAMEKPLKGFTLAVDELVRGLMDGKTCSRCSYDASRIGSCQRERLMGPGRADSCRVCKVYGDSMVFVVSKLGRSWAEP